MDTLEASVTMIRALAEEQHGVVHVRQLSQAGTVARRLAVRRAAGLVRVTPAVYRLFGSAPTALQRAMTAVLDAGPEPQLSHSSAAALWGVPGFLLEPWHATAHRSRTHRVSATLATVHRPRLMLPRHVTVFDGVPVTTPTRTIFDLASIGLHPKRVERALDSAWAMGLVNHGSLVECLDQLAERGRSGVSLMRDLIAERAANFRPPESNLEARFKYVLARAGLRPMDRQVNVGDDARWLGRVDFIDRELKLLVPIHSERYHSALLDQRHDAEQRAALEAAGWTVVPFTDVDCFHRSDQVVETVRATRARLERLRRPAA